MSPDAASQRCFYRLRALFGRELREVETCTTTLLVPPRVPCSVGTSLARSKSVQERLICSECMGKSMGILRRTRYRFTHSEIPVTRDARCRARSRRRKTENQRQRGKAGGAKTEECARAARPPRACRALGLVFICALSAPLSCENRRAAASAPTAERSPQPSREAPGPARSAMQASLRSTQAPSTWRRFT